MAHGSKDIQLSELKDMISQLNSTIQTSTDRASMAHRLLYFCVII